MPQIPEPLVLPPSPRVKPITHVRSYPHPHSRLVAAPVYRLPASSNELVKPDRHVRGGRPRLNVDIPLTPWPYLLESHLTSDSSSSSSGTSSFSPSSISSSNVSGSGWGSTAHLHGTKAKKKLPPWLSSSSGSFDAEREVAGVLQRPCEVGIAGRVRGR